MSKFFKALQQAEQDRALRLRPGSTELAAGPEEPAEPVIDAPQSGWMPTGATGLDEHLVTLLRPSSFEAGQYRTLAHFLERGHDAPRATRVVGISSPGGGDGKTITALNLAGALAQDPRHRVLLLEADLRRPTLAKYLGIPESGRGLGRAIADPRCALREAITTLPGVRLDVLAAEQASSAPYDVLRSSRVEDLLLEARQGYDYVIVDCPPLVGVPEGRVIERLVDGLVLVVCAHRTPRSLLAEALRIYDEGKILGLVFNEDDRLAVGYGRSYHYGDGAPSRNGKGHRRDSSA